MAIQIVCVSAELPEICQIMPDTIKVFFWGGGIVGAIVLKNKCSSCCLINFYLVIAK